MNYIDPDAFEIIKPFIGQKIVNVKLNGRTDQLEMLFEDGKTLCLTDNGRVCCGQRYLTCDDDLDWFAGKSAAFLDIDFDDVPYLETAGTPDEDDLHEIVFVTIQTDKSPITLCTHNVHNGNYSGFELWASVITPENQK